MHVYASIDGDLDFNVHTLWYATDIHNVRSTSNISVLIPFSSIVATDEYTKDVIFHHLGPSVGPVIVNAIECTGISPPCSPTQHMRRFVASHLLN